MADQPNPPVLNAEFAWLRPGHEASSQAVGITFADGTISKVETDQAISGGKGLFAMPALVNAHDHARGLHHLAFGARDEPFETWRGALYAQPRIDPYLNALYAFSRMALAGIGTTLCVYSSIKTDRLIEDAVAIARAARDVGIRVGFVVPLRNQCTMALGDDQLTLSMHDRGDQDTIRSTWLNDWPAVEDYVSLVGEVAAHIENDMIAVQYGPNSPHACDPALTRAIGERSAKDGRRIHTHFLESEPQHQWAKAHYPNGLVRHLKEVGWLSERLTTAHGIWLDETDLALMAEAGTTVAINTSSNLRVFSGLSPVDRYLAHGVGFAFGMDSFSLDDDDDMFRELKLSYWLHSPAHRHPRLTLDRFYDEALNTGFRIVMNRDGYGRIEPGSPADLVVLDYAKMGRDVIEGMIDPSDVVLTRACNRYVRDLFVAGKQVVAEGRLVNVDFEAVEDEIFAASKAQGERMRALQPVLRRHQQTLARFYQAGNHRRRTV
ncbi:amidohydrolase family protein [Methyloligella sp. 2.7D]|uniref:amidohydrolase family protein n=1 Tax=unclassified Methyloligella TaxID=2625955 RepID=UPI00157BEBB0|nr:amidohydrolase family protein [Methyloligella sp. GL2]QKP77151.1 amidohydrolase family protein [Methyloligella sp. GL2]